MSEIILKDLHRLFRPDELDWRIQQAGIKNGKPWGICLCYVDARAVMNRLDAVCGPENWKDDYIPVQTSSGEIQGILCALSIKINGEWVTKKDGAPETNVEAFKGGLSKAFVRCAVKWGIGRYLYNQKTNFAQFVERNTNDAKKAKIDGQNFYWLPPKQKSND